MLLLPWDLQIWMVVTTEMATGNWMVVTTAEAEMVTGGELEEYLGAYTPEILNSHWLLPKLATKLEKNLDFSKVDWKQRGLNSGSQLAKKT